MMEIGTVLTQTTSVGPALEETADPLVADALTTSAPGESVTEQIGNLGPSRVVDTLETSTVSPSANISIGAEGGVVMTMQLAHLDAACLAGEPAAQAAIEAAIKTNVAKYAGSSVSAEDVALAVLEGDTNSTVVRANITAPVGVKDDAVKASLSSTPDELKAAVAAETAKVDGIEKCASGEIAVTDAIVTVGQPDHATLSTKARRFAAAVFSTYTGPDVAFKAFDLNMDGMLGQGEFVAAGRAVKYDGDPVVVFVELDSNQDSFVMVGEFSALKGPREIAKEFSTAILATFVGADVAFDHFDVSADGKLNIGEFRNAARAVGLSEVYVDEVFDIFDVNQDRIIGLDEFLVVEGGSTSDVHRRRQAGAGGKGVEGEESENQEDGGKEGNKGEEGEVGQEGQEGGEETVIVEDRGYAGRGSNSAAHRRRQNIATKTVPEDVMWMPLGVMSSVAPVIWTGVYETLDDGKCSTLFGKDPETKQTPKMDLAKCQATCDKDVACFGYSWSEDKVCHAWRQSGLRGGGNPLGSCSCITKIFTLVKDPVAPSQKYANLGKGMCLQTMSEDYPESEFQNHTAKEACSHLSDHGPDCFGWSWTVKMECYLWKEPELRAGGGKYNHATECNLKLYRRIGEGQPASTPATSAPILGPNNEIMDDILMFPIGHTTSATPAVWTGAYEKLMPLQGKCMTPSGREPEHRYVSAVEEEQCSKFCASNSGCFGYSWSSTQQCLLWKQADLKGGGKSSNGFECSVKRFALITEPVEATMNYKLIGPGQCRTAWGTAPAALHINTFDEGIDSPGQAEKECRYICGTNPSCHGYQWSSRWRGHCDILMESGLRSGEHNSGPWSCHAKVYVVVGQGFLPDQPSPTTAQADTNTSTTSMQEEGLVVGGVIYGNSDMPRICTTELPGKGWPGPTDRDSHDAWPGGRQPDNLECWPKNNVGGYQACEYKKVVRDTEDGWPGKCLDLTEKKLRTRSCRDNCGNDPYCAVWQEAPDGKCMQGIGSDCYGKVGHLGYTPKAAQRVQHGEIRVLADLRGLMVQGLKRMFDKNYFSDERTAIAHCRAICYSNFQCQYWLYTADGCRVEAPPEFAVRYPLTLNTATRDSEMAEEVIAGEFIQHYCPVPMELYDENGFFLWILPWNWAWDWPWNWRVDKWPWPWRYWNRWRWYQWFTFITTWCCIIMIVSLCCGLILMCGCCPCIYTPRKTKKAQQPPMKRGVRTGYDSDGSWTSSSWTSSGSDYSSDDDHRRGKSKPEAKGKAVAKKGGHRKAKVGAAAAAGALASGYMMKKHEDDKYGPTSNDEKAPLAPSAKKKGWLH